ncbi:MAG: hypothetical protein NTY83_04275, partial [Candidatus Micrarchaeota archaeon]|nr:hypothetical protein [Candidatus Micrarchaeota archaeon]
EAASRFIDFTEKSNGLVLKMLGRERDGDVVATLLEQIGTIESHTLNRYAGCIAQAINRHIQEEPGIVSTFFNRVAPGMDMEKLVERLTPETRRLLAEGGNPGGRFTFHYIVAYGYFRAACEGRLIEAEVMGNRFKYFLLPAEKIGESPGRVNQCAIAVSGQVPENLRPIVAYHEYVEGQAGGSHKKAVEAEIGAVRSLGLEAEYREWTAKLEPKATKERDAYL